MTYSVTPTEIISEVKEMIPEESKITAFTANWFTLETDMKWEEVRKHFRGVATVSILHEQKPRSKKK